MKWFIDIRHDGMGVGGWAVYLNEFDEDSARDLYAKLTEADPKYSVRLRKAEGVLDLGEIVAAHFAPGEVHRDHVAPHFSIMVDAFEHTILEAPKKRAPVTVLEKREEQARKTCGSALWQLYQGFKLHERFDDFWNSDESKRERVQANIGDDGREDRLLTLDNMQYAPECFGVGYFEMENSSMLEDLIVAFFEYMRATRDRRRGSSVGDDEAIDHLIAAFEKWFNEKPPSTMPTIVYPQKYQRKR
jgi:hypothetical protein